LVGGVVTTLADDGLRVRSEPRISDDAFKFEPLLPLGTDLYVLNGPVSASGYAWYEVVPLASRSLPSGWVASADRDGKPWIAVGEFACPKVPTDFRSLAALAAGVGVHCFPRVPITVEARLVDNCNIDPPVSWLEPRWFNGVAELIAPTDRVGPGCFDAFLLNLEPTVEQPEVLGQIVQVTGVFDHPTAARCTWTTWDPIEQKSAEPVASSACRLTFAVSQLLVHGP
jgi:hypothetical protein